MSDYAKHCLVTGELCADRMWGLCACTNCKAAWDLPPLDVFDSTEEDTLP